MNLNLIAHLTASNHHYTSTSDASLRTRLAEEGQHPHAIIICCSDSRVVPEHIFEAQPGDLFVIRVAGNVLDNHQLGSIEYAAAHLGCELVVMLGHTGCGAVAAALEGSHDGYIAYITEDIREAIGEEKDPVRASELNVLHGVERIREEFALHPEIAGLEVRGAMYDIRTGEVKWL